MNCVLFDHDLNAATTIALPDDVLVRAADVMIDKFMRIDLEKVPSVADPRSVEMERRHVFVHVGALQSETHRAIMFLLHDPGEELRRVGQVTRWMDIAPSERADMVDGIVETFGAVAIKVCN